MSNEFKTLLRNVLGATALASLLSWFTFLAPAPDNNQDESFLSEDTQREAELSQNNDIENKGVNSGNNRLPSSFYSETHSPQREDQSLTSVGQREGLGSAEYRDIAYESQASDGGSLRRTGRFNTGANEALGDTPNALPFNPPSSTTPESSPEPNIPPANDECIQCITTLPTPPSEPENPSSPPSSPDNPSTESFTQVTCSQDMAEGAYASSISVAISCSESATIWYCLDTGGSPCTPSIEYTGAIALTTDGNYGISYYAVASASTTSVDDLTYKIDTTAPDLTVNHDLLYAQTTQVPLINTTSSNDFGTADYYYHQINFKSFDPFSAATPWSCSEVFSNYATATPTPVVIQSDFSVSGLTISDQINQSVDMPKLAIGDNYIATIIEDRLLGVVNCQIQNVVVKDFAIADFTGTGSTPVVTGVRRTLGSFVGFGHFQAIPNTTTSGQLSNTQVTTSNKQGLYTVTH